MDRRGIEKYTQNPGPVVAIMFTVLSLLYGAVVLLNRLLFSMGIRKSRSVGPPVVSVGNIALGGGGKTPIVMWIAAILKNRGIKVAVLSRGYSRKGRGTLILGGRTGKNDPEPEQYGDEPCLIFKRTGLPVYISANRYDAAAAAQSDGEVDIFLMDDGFQHYPLKRNLDIVTIDNRRRLGNGKLIPAGILREPASRLADADLVMVTKAGNVDDTFSDHISAFTDAPVCWTDYRVTGLIRGTSETLLSANQLTGRRFIAFSGIADPASFENLAGNLPGEMVESVRFRDHHLYTLDDVNELNRFAISLDANALVTTEKDMVRWPGQDSGIECFALIADPVFLKGEEVVLGKIFSLLEKEFD